MSAPTAIAAGSTLSGQADFSDWLSPILVKELRQGLKSRVFVGTFIVMQIVMIMTMGLWLLEKSERASASSGFDAFFWAMLWLPLLLLMPARGLGAVSEETRANTFDLVQLTRMTAYRIAFGKWIGLVAQTILLTAALLPYALLRYYFGGVDVVSDLAGIASMLMMSMVLTAAAVALSSAAMAVRVLVLAVVLPLTLLGLSGFTLFRIFRGFPGGMSFYTSYYSGTGWWLMLGTSTAIYVGMLLEFAAAKFAPAAENHPARKRAVALLLTLLFPASAWLGGLFWFQSLMLNFLPLIGWVAIEALTETGFALPAIYAPFARRGIAARCLGRVLYPGWTTAVPFVLLLFGIITLATNLLPDSAAAHEENQMRLVLFFALISPLPLMMLFPGVRHRFWLYLILQLMFGLLFAATSIVADSPVGHNPDAFRWLALFPTAALMAIATHVANTGLVADLVKATNTCGLVILAILSPMMWREFRRIRQRERVALDQMTNAGS